MSLGDNDTVENIVNMYIAQYDDTMYRHMIIMNKRDSNIQPT